MRCSALQWQQGLPFHASHPSRMMSGNNASAATGSAQLTLQTAFTARPAKAIKARYPQTADSAASARNAALPVVIESCRFCAASQGMIIAASPSTAIPIRLGWASTCPNNVRTEVVTTNAASTNSNPPAILPARSSACSRCDDALKCRNTTAAERSSTALSPPKARSARLRAVQAAPNETPASTLIQRIVSV